jgi:uncharacterized caspase-like protein
MDKQEPSLLKAKLSMALLASATMATKEGRDIIVNELTFKSQITRNAADNLDVFSIVNACLKAQDGLTTLVDLLAAFEGESQAIGPVRDAVEALQRYAIGSSKPAPNPAKPAQAAVMTALATADEPVAVVLGNDASASSAVGAAPIASTREEPMGFYEGPAFALVIGISRYKDGGDPNRILKKEQFTHLVCPEKDATRFADFLKQYSPIKYTVQLLLNDEASLTRIKDEFEELRRRCKQSGKKNPLVIVYFSGHGTLDEDDRSYLVPHDAQRNKLFSTAFWNKDFSNCLNELGTRRLVVFLDACHSGAIGAEGVKLTPPDRYDAQKDLSPHAGYIIASCGPGQTSHEGEENSIFTEHLLELLKCETDDIREENVDLFHLYKALREKVKMHNENQEPIAEIQGPTGIILAVNQQVREQTRKKKIEFVEMLGEKLKELKQNAQFKKSATLRSLLESYAEGTATENKYATMFEIFDEFFDCWSREDNFEIGECCRRLTDAFTRADGGRKLSALMLER